MQSFNRDIDDIINSMASIVKKVNEKNVINKKPEYKPDDFISSITLNADNYSIYFKEDKSSNLSKDSYLTLLNLLINTDDKSESIIDRLELCYNIYIFNKLLKNNYKDIHTIIKDFITKNASISQNKILNFYCIKFIEKEDELNKIYSTKKSEDASILSNNIDNINSIDNLENNINILHSL